MKATRIITAAVAIVTAGMVFPAVHGQQVGARRTDLQRHDLSITGREVVQTIVELEPGTTAPRHTHPGEEVIYILDGTWEYTVEGKPPVTLKAGDVLFIPAGAIHSARNVGATRGTELATYILQKGKPLVELAAPASQSAKDVHSRSPGEKPMPTPTMLPKTANLFTPADLGDASKTTGIARSDVESLRAVADWIKTFVARPHKDLGHAGPVCPFVPTALEREILWIAPEQITGRSVPDVVQLVSAYKKQFLATEPTHGDDTTYKSLVVVFTDLPADDARSLFDDILQQLAVPAYAEDGLVLGAFYPTNEGNALYNPSFRPFTSPVPFLLMRHAVIDDWKFFLDNDDMLNLWAQRYGESAVHALAEELRRQPWRARRD